LAATDGKACPDWAPDRMGDRLYDMYLPRDDLVALGERRCLSPAITCRWASCQDSPRRIVLDDRFTATNSALALA